MYDLHITGHIGSHPATAQNIAAQIQAHQAAHCKEKDRPLRVFISSLGGSVQEGLQIYNLLREHGNAQVTLFGLVASAATIIAMGARTITADPKSLILIHRSSNLQELWGQLNAPQIAEAIAQLKNNQDTLEKIDQVIASIYADRSQGSSEEFLATMDKNEWLTTTQAQDLGLIDQIDDAATLPTAQNLAQINNCTPPPPPTPIDTPPPTKGNPHPTDHKHPHTDTAQSREQLEAFEGKIESIAQSLGQRLEALQQRIEALENQDGDHSHAPTPGEHTDTHQGANLLEYYNQFKHLL